MNRLLIHGSVESIPFYNCSWKPEEEWWRTGVKRPLLGVPIALFGVVIELLYIPIIYIIFKTRLIRHACYKLIVLLVFTDMTATTCSCLITGTLLIQGAVFCVYPTFIYISGAIALSSWCAACSITICLFLNRIVSMGLKEKSVESQMAYVSIVVCLGYWFFVCFFTPPACFNSMIMAWPSDPLSEREPSEEASNVYKNNVQAWNNWIFITCMFLLFTVYCVMVKKLSRGQKSKAARSIFLQCSIICFFNTVTAVVYNILSIVTPDPWILIVGQVAWSSNHGCPAFIYVTMNMTIRREFKRLFFGIKRLEETNSSVGHSSNIKSRVFTVTTTTN